MTEEINKSYVRRYVDRAKVTASEEERNNCLYRAGTHMEIIPCDGNDHLTPKQKQTVLDAADELLGGRDAE